MRRNLPRRQKQKRLECLRTPACNDGNHEQPSDGVDQYRPGDYETAWRGKTFENGAWGGEIRPGFEPQPNDIVAQEHWCSSGFANTDLDLQLKKHGIHKLIVIGLIAHTRVEATVRYAAEPGYEVTMAKDATADFSDKEMHACLDVNLPSYASAIVTAGEIVEVLSFHVGPTQSASNASFGSMTGE
jgi:ureidoacrylate peracid hydrolase